jgi:polyisoprenyl-phosphate glycosyltransferase
MVMPQLSVVVPCFNEALGLRETTKTLLAIINQLIGAGKINSSSRVYFVDDGSSDDTWSLIQDLASDHAQVSGIKLSTNRGHQNALLAGLFSAPGDILISIDADLQDDVDAIEKMVTAYGAGSDIVYGVRDDRSTDTRFKRVTAQAFYVSMGALGVKVIYNHADYRLMSRRAVEALRGYKEVNLFLRGIIPLIGFNSTVVTYRRGSRNAGKSKYPLPRMLSLAWEGVTSMSSVPLRMVTVTGTVVFIATMVMSIAVVAIRLFSNRALPGWASTVLPIYLLGGIQILCIGILGEYLAKIYKEVKSRPRFVIEDRCGADFNKSE